MKSFKFFITAIGLIISASLISTNVSAQKWKKSKPETLYARNKKKNLTPIFVGIGTKTPTAQFHTTGSVRFQGLTVNNNLNTVVAIDGSGNLFWRDISNTNSNSWFLNGNIISPSNFFGTTTNDDIRVRTNNIQRAVITSTGLLGLGVTIPSAQLHTNGTVRFEGLVNNDGFNRIVSIDNSGNLFWRDAASIVGTTAWLLNGNNAISSSFLGTTVNEDLRIRTNNIQRAVLTTNGSFGLGVSTTTAQLHTNGSVRFEGVTSNNTLQRLALFDVNGNLFYRDLVSLQSNFWSLTGNTGTNPATNFLGTTDNNRLVFRTNNTEKVTILSNGNVGIGLSNPGTPLHVYSLIDDNQLSLSGSAPSTRYFQGSDWLASPYHARIGLATGNANYVATSSPGDFIVQALDNGNLLFGTNGAGGNGLERMRINASGNVGISTLNPTAKLHTNGTLRFEGLASGTGNPLVVDANGNVFIGTGGASNVWNLTGNAATNPTINFLGTTDNNRLVFRTNNTEKMTILSNGNVGINNTNPSSILEINNTNPDNHLVINGVAPSINFRGTGLGPNEGGRLGFATQNNNFTQGSLPSDFIVQTLGATANLIFGTGGGGTGNGIERARINPVGYFGIATFNPTAKLHVNCLPVAGQTNPSNIRFENLPIGTGNALVMDANGYVYKSNTLTGRPTNNEVIELKDEIQNLKNEIEDLKSIVNSMKEGFLNIDQKKTEAILYQNAPNPFKNVTIIRYYIPKGPQKAYLLISDLQGKVLKNYSLNNEGQQSITINGGELSAGTYLYTLFEDGHKVDSKKMVLTR